MQNLSIRNLAPYSMLPIMEVTLAMGLRSLARRRLFLEYRMHLEDKGMGMRLPPRIMMTRL